MEQHYSHPFRTRTRLDYFFINAPSLWALNAVDIHPLSWSDHALILFKLSLADSRLKRCHWQLNDFLLKNISTKADLGTALKKLKLYFAENTTPDISSGTLWEAHKSVIRGQCIAISTAWKKNTTLTELLIYFAITFPTFTTIHPYHIYPPRNITLTAYKLTL